VAYKSIDLQASLPRTAELTPLAQQQQHRPILDQAMLAQQTAKTAEQQSRRLTETESSAKGEIGDGQGQGRGQRSAKGKKQSGGTTQENENRSEHPFKGKHIDFMG
jgi:hypothetical protein